MLLTAWLTSNPLALCDKQPTSWLSRPVRGQSFTGPTQGCQVTGAEVRVDTRGRCWTVLAEPGNLSYLSSSKQAGIKSWQLPDAVRFRFLEVAGSPGLGGAKRHANGCEDLSEVWLGSFGLLPSWGAGCSEAWVALQDLGLPPEPETSYTGSAWKSKKN